MLKFELVNWRHRGWFVWQDSHMQVQVDVMHLVCSLYACLPIRLLYSILRNTFTATATAAIIIEASHKRQCKWYVFQSTILAAFWLGREKGSSVCSAWHQNSGNMFSLVSCGSPCGLLSPFSISPLLLLMMARSLSCWSRLAYLYHGRYSKNAATGELSCSLHYHTVYTYPTHTLANTSLPHSSYQVPSHNQNSVYLLPIFTWQSVTRTGFARWYSLCKQ